MCLLVFSGRVLPSQNVPIFCTLIRPTLAIIYIKAPLIKLLSIESILICNLYLIFKRLLYLYVFDLILHLTNIIIAISEYCISGTTCFAMARRSLMLFDQICKHCWWREGMHLQHLQRWNRP